MYCPHCGAENDEEDRFCVNCGSDLKEIRSRDATSSTLKERIRRIVGSTRRSQLVTAATVIALVVAAVALFALDPDDDEAASSPYLQKVDESCVAEKERISALEREALGQRSANPQAFASVLVTALAEWRETLRQAAPPPENQKEVEALEDALIETMIEAAKLSRLIRQPGPSGAIARQAGAVDASTQDLDETIGDTGLPSCADVQVSPSTEAQS